MHIKEIKWTLDPFEVFNIFKESDEIIFLDSGRDFDELGRYSFIGLNPYKTFRYKDKKCKINNKVFNGNCFKELDRILSEENFENKTGLPFIGGGIGYFSYNLLKDIESIEEISVEDIIIPECYFNFYDNIIIFDNLNNKCVISALGKLCSENESIYKIEKLIYEGNNIEKKDFSMSEYNIDDFKSNFQKEEYIKALSKIRDYIRNGDIYIANLTQRFEKEIEKKPFEVYEKLRTINPAPFAAYMNLSDFKIISSSPERFLKIKNRIVETRPIKGTRPRGKDEEEDLKFKKELLNSEKDKSELLMIVDLERNDLSKVCKPNSVKVTELFKLEEYSTVFHLVSTVIGKLKDECSSLDLIEATFPGGSITGAPKIRAMEIIDEIEKVKRNIYTGAIGYLGFDGNVDLNIAIRTIFMKGNKAYFGVGGGITYESIEEMEYEETIDKAKALMKALN